jgi:hypothetical protein
MRTPRTIDDAALGLSKRANLGRHHCRLRVMLFVRWRGNLAYDLAARSEPRFSDRPRLLEQQHPPP